MKKKTFFETICPVRLSTRDTLIVGWFCMSLALLAVDDAPLWFIVLDCLNFAASALFLNKIKINNEEDNNEQD